jgi:hypothetical protein
MRPETVLVSVMAVNNEIGVVQPLKQIGELCRSKKIFFHTDAAQVHTPATKHHHRIPLSVRPRATIRAGGPHETHGQANATPSLAVCAGGADRTCDGVEVERYGSK